MITRICSVLLVTVVTTSMLVAESTSTRSPRHEAPSTAHPQDVWLTESQAQQLVVSVNNLIKQVQELSAQNKAPRPGAVPGDPSYPACNTCDISCLLSALCALENQLFCCCGTLLDVLGSCTDLSVVLPSQVDKSDIDALCISVVALLKTVLLELRGVFLAL